MLTLGFGALAASVATEQAGLHPMTAWTHRSLVDVWTNYDEAPLLDHWVEYAEHYEENFPTPDGRTPLKMLEIGVQSGGSARAWKQFYGAPLTYVGIDINPPCKRTESPAEKIFVEIGSQLDGTFLRGVCAKHGPFDMVIDDGGHTANMMNYSLRTIWSTEGCLTPRAVYTIEDMHTGAMCPQVLPPPAAAAACPPRHMCPPREARRDMPAASPPCTHPSTRPSCRPSARDPHRATATCPTTCTRSSRAPSTACTRTGCAITHSARRTRRRHRRRGGPSRCARWRSTTRSPSSSGEHRSSGSRGCGAARM